MLADRIEPLLDALAARVRERGDPFERLIVAVPSRLVERRAELAVARALGIAAGLTLTRLPVELESRLGSASRRRVLSSELIEALVRETLLTPERLESDALAPVRAYVEGADGAGSRMLRERRACELASRLARLYASYTLDRPELVREWLHGARPSSPNALLAWQGALLAEALAPFDGDLVTLAEGVDALARDTRAAPLVVLGYSFLSRLEHALIGAIATQTDVLVLTPTPCAEFWEDASARAIENSAASESALLASWGMAAREHVAMLDAATDYAATRIFAESSEATRLSRVQASIRERRAPSAAAASERDDSIVLVRAPSLRREVEIAAGEIWARVHRAARTDAPLRFPDVAVWIPSRARDLYLPHIEAVFAEARDLPWSGVDLSLATHSRVVDALVRLVTLVAEGPSRSRLLDVILHPLVLACVPGEPEPEAIAAAVERLGVFFGGDRSELPASYALDPRAVDLTQAIERLALGEAMLGERSGDDRFFERPTDGATSRWLPEESELDGGAASLVLLLRSLASDVAHARAASLTIDGWARFFVALAESYVRVDEGEQAEHRRALLALRSLGGPSLEGGAELERAAACNLALGALDSLPAARGASDRGVLVGTLGPHRASDHRLVLVLGLGEARFPSRDPNLGLDLRADDRRAGEVSAEARDRLALLEALVSARDALVLSWVARDEQTGDELAPAHVLNELRAISPGIPERRPSLRRDLALMEAAQAGDPDALVSALAFPIAELEARARLLGDEEREAWANDATPLAKLARDLAPDDTRRVSLALAAIPARPTTTSTEPVRVSLDQLRGFLDCPTQAAARRVVGRDDDDDARSIDAEPFELDELEHIRLVRAIVLGSIGDGSASIDGISARAVAHGAFPLGAFGARARALAEEDARQVLERLTLARAWARSAGAVRFGAGREHDGAAPRAFDPISLGMLSDGRPLELVGTTAPLLAVAATDLEQPLRFDLGSLRASERQVVVERRLALHAFLDHAALTLGTGNASPRPRRALVVSRRGALEIQLKAIPPDLARRWLAGLAKELLAEPQTSFMPIESVLRVAHLFKSGSASLEQDLLRSIETVRNKWDGGRSRYGPIRGVVQLPAPSGPARLAGQRFSIFFAHLLTPTIEWPKKERR